MCPLHPQEEAPVCRALGSLVLPLDASDRCYDNAVPLVSNTEKRQNVQMGREGSPKVSPLGSALPLQEINSQGQKNPQEPQHPFGKWLTAHSLEPSITGFESFLYQFPAMPSWGKIF